MLCIFLMVAEKEKQIFFLNLEDIHVLGAFLQINKFITHVASEKIFQISPNQKTYKWPLQLFYARG
jgi:hypothetical protein